MIKLLLIAGGLYFIFSGSTEYRGYYYPNASDLSKHTYTGTFDSLAACEAATYISNSKNTNWDAECAAID